MTVADISADGRRPHLEMIRGGADIDLGRAERAVADHLTPHSHDIND